MDRAALRTGLARATASSLVKTLLVLAVAVFNPFNILQWSERHSFEVWENVFGPSYPKPIFSGKDQPEGRNALSVLYIDEASLAGAETSWPLSFEDHGLILQDICGVAAHGPAAIFVDFTFGGHGPSPARLDEIAGGAEAATTACQGREGPATASIAPPSPTATAAAPLKGFESYAATVASITRYPRWRADPLCQHDPLAKLDCIAKAGGVPVIFADSSALGEPGEASSDGAQEPDPTAPLSTLGRIAITAPVGLSSEGYALVGRPGPGAAPFALSPAALMYAVYCRSRPCSPPPSPATSKPAGWSRAFDAPVYVEWGVGRPDPFTAQMTRLSDPNADTKDKAKPDCRPGARAFGGVVARGVHVLLAGTHLGPSLPNCSYAHALAASDLDKRGVTTEAVDMALDGKLVLFGGRFREGGDWVASPLLGSVPGVDYHAMALDNLIEFGARYPREAPPLIAALDLHWGKMIELGVVFFTAFAFRVVEITRNDIHEGDLAASRLATDGRRRFGTLVLIWGAIVAPTIAIAVLLARLFSFSPLNWVGVLIAALPWFPEGLPEWLELLVEKSQVLHLLHISPRLLAWTSVEDVTWSRGRGEGHHGPVEPKDDPVSEQPAAEPPVQPHSADLTPERAPELTPEGD